MFQILHTPYYRKKAFAVDLKFKMNQASCILGGNSAISANAFYSPDVEVEGGAADTLPPGRTGKSCPAQTVPSAGAEAPCPVGYSHPLSPAMQIKGSGQSSSSWTT